MRCDIEVHPLPAKQHRVLRHRITTPHIHGCGITRQATTFINAGQVPPVHCISYSPSPAFRDAPPFNQLSWITGNVSESLAASA